MGVVISVGLGFFGHNLKLGGGVVINGARWKKLMKMSKIGQKLHEFKRIATILEKLPKYFSRIMNWVGGGL